MLEQTQWLNEVVIGTRGRARLYKPGDVDRDFRINGFDTPGDARTSASCATTSRSYRLVVDGEVERKQAFSLAELRALPALTQITRHDCVEGWSAIGEWGGVPLGQLLRDRAADGRGRATSSSTAWIARPTATPYYESLESASGAHPQTLLALDLNGKPLDPDHGAPVRLRIPTQLGYKSAKWVNRIELARRLRPHLRRQGRLLGRQRLRVVRRHLSAAA